MRILLAASAALLIFCSACKSVPLITVYKYHKSVGGQFVKYLEADTSLDANSKRIRRQAYDSMDRLMIQMKAKPAPTPPN
ncbi:hypothetical protein LCGC14_1040800 [marine sediment metagenome]|uniref:Uncharacterized protein n=1 Tax=marine sediment metagenome TaxID=412755 RepID=A0A0F9MRM4_9ZZZZ